MNTKEFIRTYDNVLEWEILSSFIKVMNKKKFEDAGLVSDTTINQKQVVDKKIRKTQSLNFNHPNDSLTNLHWGNFLRSRFKPFINSYVQEFTHNPNTKFVKAIIDMQCLKYEEGGHYVYHVDSAYEVPRCLSMILMLNNDYEGGNLKFKFHDEEIEKEKRPNRLNISPSSFMYPHCVTPIEKGIRYSIVAWAL